VLIAGADAVPDTLRAIAAGSMTAAAVAILTAAFARNRVKPKSREQFALRVHNASEPEQRNRRRTRAGR